MTNRVLGIDPGSRLTGFGILDYSGNNTKYLASGCIRTGEKSLDLRLKEIFTGIDQIVEEFEPDVVAIETVFVRRNVSSALKLGQARGAAISAAAMRSVPCLEYAPTRIKQSVVGRGHASKEQVQHMIVSLLSLPAMPQADACDALACALCHIHMEQTMHSIRLAER